MNGPSPYISLSEAGKISGYTAEYLRQLCVKGKIEGQKIGKSWVTTTEAVAKFRATQQALPLTFSEVAGTALSAHSRLQKLAATVMAVLVFFPVAATLTRLPDRIAFLRDKTSQITSATQIALDHKLAGYIQRLLGQSSGLISGTSVAYPIDFIGPRQKIPSAPVAVTKLAPATISKQMMLVALRELFSAGLPEDLKSQLQGPPGVAGPQGETGPAGVAGIPGPPGFSIGITAPTANQGAGTIGGVTYLSAKEFITEKLTVTSEATINGTLHVIGDSTLTGDLLPATDNTFTIGTSAQRWASLHSGPTGLIVHNDATDLKKVSLIFSGTTAVLGSDATTALQLTTGANPGINILTNGKVGIGTTNPQTALQIVATDALVIPVGTTAQRPASIQGAIRYNTTTSTFEGYSGSVWAGLGGVIDVDQDTYILAESAPGADEDTLFFYTNGTEKLRITPTGSISLGGTNPILDLTTSSTLNINTTTNRPVTFGTGTVTIPNLSVTNSQTGAGTFNITSNATTETIFQVTGTALTSGTAIGKTITANAGNGQVTKGETITLTDATTAGGGFTGIGITVTGAGSGSGSKYLLSLNPNTANNEVVFDNTGALRPTTSVASNTATIGSPSFYFKNGYFDQITANSIAGVVAGGATSSTTWTIGSSEAGDVNEALIFQRNSGSGNALIQWNAGAGDLRYLSANYPFNATYTVADGSIGTGINLLSSNLTNNTTGGTQKLLSLTNTGTGTTENGIYINNTGTGTTAFEIAGTWTNGIVTNNNSINAGSGTLTAGTSNLDNAVIGGGYGSSGVTISAAGAIQANGAGTFDGALTALTFNGNTISAGSGTLTLGAGKVLTISNTLTFTGTDSSSVAFGSGGTVVYTIRTINGKALSSDIVLSLASADFANQGTATTVLHGNAAGNPSFGAVVSADLNITTTSCTNQVVTAISSGAVGTCTTITSSYVDSSVGLTGSPLSQFASTTSAQLASVISDETGSSSGVLVFNNGPTITSPVITNINPGADFTLTQNSVTPFISTNAGAIANTLTLKAGKVGIGTTTADEPLDVRVTTDQRFVLRNASGILTLQTHNDGASALIPMQFRASDYRFVGSGNVLIGDSSNADMTGGLTVNQNSNDDQIFALKSTDVAHGLTTLAETDTFAAFQKISATAGGLQLTALSDTDAQALYIRGVMGSTDPTDSISAVKIIGAKSNGTTGMADLGAAETVFQVANNDNTAGFTILGNDNVGIGTTNPGAHLSITNTSDIKGAIIVNNSAQTANALEVQNSGGTPYVTVGPDTLAGDSNLKNFLNVTGTLATTNTANAVGVHVLVTGAGTSAFQQIAQRITLLAGYTGSNLTAGVQVVNTTLGTGTSSWTFSSANYGGILSTAASTTGHNVGALGNASGSSALNMGVFARSVSATNSPALNVGIGGLALNGTTNVAGFFGLMSTAPTLSSSAALIADNGGVAADIFKARDNGTDVFNIIDGGYVGIGTTNPTSLLTTLGTTGNFVSFTGSSNNGIAFKPVDASNLTEIIGINYAGNTFKDIGLRSGSATQLYLSTNGNVGIGTTNPSSIWSPTLAVSGTFAGIKLTSTSTNGGSFSIGSNVENSHRSLDIYDETAGAYRLSMNDSGSIGIGTTDPATTFHIGGGGQTGTPGYAGIYVNPNSATAQVIVEQNGGVEGGMFAHSNGNFYMGSFSSNNLYIRSGNADAMIITTAGNVGFGGSTPSYGFHVKMSKASDIVASFENTGASHPNGILINFSGNTPNNASDYFMAGIDSTTTRFVIYSNGNVVTSTGSYGTISDVRLKENISDSQSYLDILSQVHIVNYSLISEHRSQADQVGVIAQELETILPGLVDTNRDGYKSVGYSKFTPMLIRGLQELDSKTAGNYVGSVSLGDIVSASGNTQVIKATGESNAIGVVSSIGGSSARVQYVGSTTVKVSEENGAVHAGDKLTLSTQLPGYAAKQTESGQSIGTALEDSNGGVEGTDIIQAFVSIAYQHIDVAQNSNGQLVVADSDYDFNGHSLLNVKSIASLSGKWSIDENGLLIVEKVKATVLETVQGVTIKDRTTGAPYCVYVDNGINQTIAGACDDANTWNQGGAPSGEGDGGVVSGDEENPPDDGSGDDEQLNPPGDEGSGDEGSGEETPPGDEGGGEQPPGDGGGEPTP